MSSSVTNTTRVMAHQGPSRKVQRLNKVNILAYLFLAQPPLWSDMERSSLPIISLGNFKRWIHGDEMFTTQTGRGWLDTTRGQSRRSDIRRCLTCPKILSTATGGKAEWGHWNEASCRAECETPLNTFHYTESPIWQRYLSESTNQTKLMARPITFTFTVVSSPRIKSKLQCDTALQPVLSRSEFNPPSVCSNVAHCGSETQRKWKFIRWWKAEMTQGRRKQTWSLVRVLKVTALWPNWAFSIQILIITTRWDRD